MDDKRERLDSEWMMLNAVRDTIRIAAKGDSAKSTYDKAFSLGGALYPDLLGEDVSLLRRSRESDTTREYRQKAELLGLQHNKAVTPLALLKEDITEYEELIKIAGRNREDRKQSDQLKKRLVLLRKARDELDTSRHSENQLIFRDAYNVERNFPAMFQGKGWRDFRLPDERYLRIRVLHPDVPERISGVDIIYENHDLADQVVSLVAVQYKIWEGRVLYLNDKRLRNQLKKMESFVCSNSACGGPPEETNYRFPYCAGFLRTTDRIQYSDQSLISTGEHIPICKIDSWATHGPANAPVLEYSAIRGRSLSHEVFENLFNSGKIGSRPFNYPELEDLYSKFQIIENPDRVIIYSQEYD